MQQDFTEGSVSRKLLVFAAPIMAGMLLHTAYNIIDAIFIGMLGAVELAAVSLTFPVVFVFIAFAQGLGIGATALMSQAIGKKNIAAANNVAEHAVVLGAVIGIIIAVLGILFAPLIFVFMGADAQVLALAVEYSTPIFIGLIFMFAWFISDSILKSQGNSKTPMKTLAISVALNIVLNPIFIFGFGPIPAMGLFGAALATVISRIVAAALNLYYIYTPKSAISLALRYFKPNLGCIKNIFRIGLPASGSYMLTAGGFMFLTAIVGRFGNFAIAGFGIGMRLNSVAILPIIGMTSAVIAFVGQNFGAGKPERARKVALLGSKIALVITLIVSTILYLFPEQIFRVFTQDPAVIEVGKGFLAILPFMYVLYGSYFVLIGAFQGTGKAHYSFATNLSYWVIAVVLAVFLSQTMGLEGVWIAWLVAAAVELVLVNALFWSGIWLKPGQLQKTKLKC